MEQVTPGPGKKGTAPANPKPPVPPQVRPLAPAGHDPLPGGRVKGAFGAARRAFRAPDPARPLAGTGSNQGNGAQ
jgi:hypothetical protein